MRSNAMIALIAGAALASCGKPRKPDKTDRSAVTTTAMADAAPEASAAPRALPSGLRQLAAADPLPTPGSDELLLLALPGGSVTITGKDGAKIQVRDGVIAKTRAPYELPDGMTFDKADLAAIVDSGAADQRHTAQVVTRAEEIGDFPHHEVWFVPTVGARALLAQNGSAVAVDWSDPLHRFALVTIDEVASLVDVKSGAATMVAEQAGSPTFAKDGTLYYRTLDGGAWKWAGDHGEKIGKGKHGKAQTGDLNEGIERAEYPPPVTFDGSGAPHFK